MRNTPKNLFLLAIGGGLVLAAVAIFFVLLRQQKTSETADLLAAPIQVNFPAPDLQLTDLTGRPVALADFKGQVVLYNAWATWCLPCREEMPILDAYYQAHRADGFVVLAIEDGSPIVDVAAYVKELGLTFPVWPDLQFQATKAFKVEYLPVSYVIDRSGTVRLKWVAAIKADLLEKYVTPLLQEK